MLNFLLIKNFRLFKQLLIRNLNRVNLIAGENDSGKTALLEALYLLFADLDSFFKFPLAFRSGQNADDFDSFWRWLLHKKSLTLPLEISVLAEDGAEYGVALLSANSSTEQLAFSYRERSVASIERYISKGGGGQGSNPPNWPTISVFSTTPSSPMEDAEYFNRIAAKRNGEKRLINLLQVVEPRLQDLKYLKLGTQPLVYADVGMEDLIPTTQLGQAFTRLLRLFSEILVKRSRVILIDEIENGIHYKAMPQVWKGIAAIARQEDLQIFATTHSYECIRSAHEAFSSEPHYDLALHRLERVDDEIRAVTYNQTTLETSFEMNLEVR